MIARAWIRRVDHAVVFSLGFFALTAQTLLFRDFLAAVEGNELAIGCFFFSWLLWVGTGAWFAGHCGRLRHPWVRRFPRLPLLYLPAFVLQTWAILRLREWTGVQAYELFPLGRLIPLATVVNAPVSLLTGIFFTLACRWWAESESLPPARVFIVEAFGAFAGGVAVTVLLTAGVAAESVFLYTSFLLSAVLATALAARRDWTPAIAPAAAILLLLGLRADAAWARARARHAWGQALPAEGFLGSFATPHLRYAYGMYGDQFTVLAGGSVADAIPNQEHASQVAALHLAQHPAARSVLVVGSSTYSLCHRLLALPQIEKVTWIDPDPEYPRRLLAVLPRHLRAESDRLDLVSEDARAYLARSPSRYDLAILCMPDVTTLNLNRYSTLEFFQLVASRLDRRGVVGFRVAGGANVLSEALTRVGASAWHTLSRVFPYVAIKPGDETWLLASPSPILSEKPAELRDRYLTVAQAADFYPPEGVLAAYPPDRIAFQRSLYEHDIRAGSDDLLLNTDRRPKALLHALLFQTRHAGRSASPPPLLTAAGVRALVRKGLPILLAAAVLFTVLRFVFLWRSQTRRFALTSRSGPQPFDTAVLVLTTGALSMSTGILLMCAYQTDHGALFLHVGLVSALLMLGLALGSAAGEQLLVRRHCRDRSLLFVAIAFHLLLLASLYEMPSPLASGGYAALFLLSGLVSGFYVPIAAWKLNLAGRDAGESGRVLGMSDHVGGSLGGLLTGVAVLPLLGQEQTIVFLAALLVVNLPPLLLEPRLTGIEWARDSIEAWTRRAGYSLFGLCAFLLLASGALKRADSADTETLTLEAARAMAGGTAPLRRSAPAGGGRSVTWYFFPASSNQPSLYAVSSFECAPHIQGYAGPLSMVILLEESGALRDFRIIRSKETPAYLEMLVPWRDRLLGRPLFREDALKDVDAVSGATLTSEAVLRTLEETARVFAGAALAKDWSGSAARTRTVDHRTLLLALFAAAAVVLRRRPSPRLRRLWLLAVVLVFGVWLNVQYSLSHVFTLVSGAWPSPGLGIAFAVAIGIPILVALLGNLYCGYLCPFGALQELAAWLRPARARISPDLTAFRYARALKFLVLAVALAVFATSLDPALASFDPLVTLFGESPAPSVLGLGALLLFASVFYDRFWCRCLCPAGAFLSLLNGLHALRRFIPLGNFRVCLYGVARSTDLDCICCDRCRGLSEAELEQARAARAAPGSMARRLAFAATVALAAWWLLQALTTTWRESREMGGVPVGEGTARRARAVDLPALYERVEQRRLSDREAMYYRSANAPADGEPSLSP